MSLPTDLPALLGGRPLRPAGPPAWPPSDETVGRALQTAWRDGSWGRYDGGHVARLEERLADGHGVRFALTCGSGTFAVELALRCLKVGPGDEVILAAYDYGGNFLGVHAVGAVPVLIDVDPDNWNLAPERLAQAFGPSTRAVIVSHLHGGLVPMRAVREVADAHGVRVVEDAAQVPGALVEGKRAGSWGDVGVLSFGGSKLLSAGRGGAILTDHPELYQRARVVALRGNLVCPLSELQATVLLPQLELLPERHARRLHAAALLGECLRHVPGLRPFRNRLAGSEPGYYKVGFQLDETAFGLSRSRLVAAVRAEGIAMDEGFRALHVGRSPGRYRRAGPLEESERAHQGVVVLHHPVLLEPDAGVRQVAEAVRKVWRHADRLR